MLPALLFGAGLISLTCMLASTRAASESFFCSESEKSVAVCMRAWITPSLAACSFIVACFGAFVALRQLRIARQKQRLEILNERLKHVATLRRRVGAVTNHHYESWRLIKHVEMLRASSATKGLPDAIRDALQAIETLRHSRKELKEFADDASLDADVFDLAEDVLEDSYLLRVHGLRNLVDAVSRTPLVISTLERDFTLHFDRASKIAEADMERLRVHVIKADGWANAIKSDRTAALTGKAPAKVRNRDIVADL